MKAKGFNMPRGWNWRGSEKKKAAEVQKVVVKAIKSLLYFNNENQQITIYMFL